MTVPTRSTSRQARRRHRRRRYRFRLRRHLNRHGAASVTQFELMPMPPGRKTSADLATGPYKMHALPPRTGRCEPFCRCHQPWVADGKLRGIKALSGSRGMERRQDSEVPGFEFHSRPTSSSRHGLHQSGGAAAGSLWRRQRIIAAMPARRPMVPLLCDQRAQGLRRRGRAPGRSLVVWAIREGRQCARRSRSVHSGTSDPATLVAATSPPAGGVGEARPAGRVAPGRRCACEVDLSLMGHRMLR